MSEKSKQWICKFIILFIFITGMCFDEVKADSVFACTITASHTKDAVNAESIQSGKKPAVYMEKEFEVTEMIVAKSTVNTQQLIASISNGKRTLKLSVAIVYVTALGLLLSNSYVMSYFSQLPERVCKTTVVNYIHNTDGKKRV